MTGRYEWDLLFVFVMGLLLGSFANVVILRLPLDQSIVRPGSHCTSCKKTLKWFHNIPVLSFLVLRRKCAYCSAPISWRYPLIELMTACFMTLVFARMGHDHLALFWLRDLPFIWIMICITWIDLDHRIIPDELNLLGLVVGAATIFLDPVLDWRSAFLGAAIGFGAFYGIAWLYEYRTGRMGMGGGDIKLIGMLGMFIGLNGVFQTILISSIVGTIVGVAYALISKSPEKFKTSIPFGPFLVLGGMISYFWGDLWLQSMIPT